MTSDQQTSLNIPELRVFQITIAPGVVRYMRARGLQQIYELLEPSRLRECKIIFTHSQSARNPKTHPEGRKALIGAWYAIEDLGPCLSNDERDRHGLPEDTEPSR